MCARSSEPAAARTCQASSAGAPWARTHSMCAHLASQKNPRAPALCSWPAASRCWLNVVGPCTILFSGRTAGALPAGARRRERAPDTQTHVLHTNNKYKHDKQSYHQI